ncbi:hypothetical protein BANRA_04107 [Acinetobacter baumannii]|nr:hypothetical protein BANRA_04107 [Acinetobacter baumannii]
MGAIMGGGLQSAAGHSPTALAKDVAKTLRNETNTLRSDEAKARAIVRSYAKWSTRGYC